MRICLIVFVATLDRKEKSYRDNLQLWEEPILSFLKPMPKDQSMLYKTVEEVVDPVEVIDKTTRIPKWLTGTLLRYKHWKK